MDPNANLREQADYIGRSLDRGERRTLLELRRALADWIRSGGFAPDWTRYPNATKVYRAWFLRSFGH